MYGETSEYSELVTICNANDIEENSMMAFDFDENNKVLLVKQNGRLSAVGAICPHKGGLLHLGILGRGRVRCPDHGACFDIKTGDIEDFPGMDSLPCYQINLGGSGEVRVRAKLQDLNKVGRVKEMAIRDLADERCYVAIGGGVASHICVETLRQEGFTGRIVLICSENYLPYERIQLSKQMNLEMNKLIFRDAAYYRHHGIEVMLGTPVVRLDTELKRVLCSNKTWVKYDKLFIGTGGRTHKPPIPGIHFKNIFGLHCFNEYIDLHKALNINTNLVLLGAGFNSMELASLLIGRVNSVVIIDHANFPLSNAYGEDVGILYKKLFYQQGVLIEMNNGVTEILGDEDDYVSEVLTLNGKKIKCNVVIISTGVKLNTEWLASSTLAVNPNGSINTDMHLMTNVPDIYVGGDIANAPVLTFSNQRMTVGHFHLAQYHGRIAGLNMADIIEDLRVVPYFDISVFGKRLRQAGFGRKHEVYISGDLENWKFVVYIFDEDGNVLAVATCGRDLYAIQFAELCSQGKRLHRSHIIGKENPHEWIDMLLDSRTPRCPC